MTFQINTASRTPIYQQLTGQIRSAIARGELSAEERLPSVRQLSKELVVNPNTIARAYLELEREGILTTRQGLGVFVAPPRRELMKKVRDARLQEHLNRLLTEAVHLGYSADEVSAMVERTLEEFQWPK